MAKTAKKKAKKAKLVVTAVHLKDAGAIVAEVVVHFGAGYATQRHTEGTTAPVGTDAIFTKHGDFLKFHRHLVGCTSRNIARGSVSVSEWKKPNSVLRQQVTLTAFAHGVMVRKLVVTDGTGAITESQVMATLAIIKTACPAGTGGAGVCEDTN